MTERKVVPTIEITLRQAQELVGVFGGDDALVTVRDLPVGAVAEDPHDPDDGLPSPAGLWAHFSEYPEEGCLFLGRTELAEDAAPAEPPAQEPDSMSHAWKSGYAQAKEEDKMARDFCPHCNPCLHDGGDKCRAPAQEPRDDLVERLNEWGNLPIVTGDRPWQIACREASDRIAGLERIAQMREETVASCLSRAEAAESRCAAMGKVVEAARDHLKRWAPNSVELIARCDAALAESGP